MEVRILACQSKDPALVDYIVGGGDMHGDWAERIFQIRKEEIDGQEFEEKYRYRAKNRFVFPEFYGSWWRSIAKDIEAPDYFYPTLTDRRRRERWEGHLKDCEEEFWRQFKGVREWQDRKVEEYKRQGYIEDGAWGFRRYGYIGRNKLFNFPIQGTAFHCLLWSIIELGKRGYDWKSLLCGQIHDSMFWDGQPNEFNKVREAVDKVMTEDIREANPWIIIPLKVDWKRGLNWLEMEDVE